MKVLNAMRSASICCYNKPAGVVGGIPPQCLRRYAWQKYNAGAENAQQGQQQLCCAAVCARTKRAWYGNQSKRHVRSAGRYRRRHKMEKEGPTPRENGR